MEKNQTGTQDNRQDRDFDVVVVGEINVDLILKGNIEPAFGQIEKIVDKASLTIGSSAAIFACGAARLGLRTAFIGAAGDDAFGRFMVEALNRRGIDTSGIIVNPNIDTGISVILVKASDRAILTYPGSIPELKYSDIDFSILARSRHLHLSSYFLLDNLRPHIPSLFQKARSMGLSLSLDTNFDPLEKWEGGLHQAIAAADIFLPNLVELQAITGEATAERAAARLSESVQTVVVKLGADGAAACVRGGNMLRQAAAPVNVVDTVGAGDSFDAGFIYGFLNGMDTRQSLKMAVACGSLSTRGAGGTSAQPDLNEALEFAGHLE
jgi:sugar/nucleoside kinase (ribokinase family)